MEFANANKSTGNPEEAHQTISLCANPLERSPKKLPPQKKSPEGGRASESA